MVQVIPVEGRAGDVAACPAARDVAAMPTRLPVEIKRVDAGVSAAPPLSCRFGGCAEI
jgi:hypothetical protein